MSTPEFEANSEIDSVDTMAQARRLFDAVRAGLAEQAAAEPLRITGGIIPDDPAYVERARAWQAERNRLMFSSDPAERRQALLFGVIPSPEPPVIGQ